MQRLLIVAAASAATASAALLIRRIRPTGPDGASRLGEPPDLVDLADFGSCAGSLLLVFTSGGCEACARTMASAAGLATDDLTVLEVSREDSGHLHARYGIEAVPTVLFVDREGLVRSSFVGSPSVPEMQRARAGLSPG